MMKEMLYYQEGLFADDSTEQTTCTTSYGVSVEEMSDKQLMATALGIKEASVKYGDVRSFATAPAGAALFSPKQRLRAVAIKELAKRINVIDGVNLYENIVRGPQTVYNIMKSKLRFEPKEHFMVMMLSVKSNVIGIESISEGTLSASVVHPREVFAKVVLYPAASIILVHNHPSGNPTPSPEDINVTEQLVKAGKIFDIPVLDHVIIGDNRYFSMQEHGSVALG